MDQNLEQRPQVDHQPEPTAEQLPELEQASELRVLTLQEIRTVAGGISGYYSDGGFGRRIISRNAGSKPCDK